jgi:Ca2+-binding EF-hand superfamily protein
VFKLRGILKTSNANLREVFASFDSDGSGKLSNLEFKNALRQLNLGLTSKEIDMLLNYIDESGDGKINWEEFSKKLEST